MTYVFFFSSRRRHTSSYGDWSSDVCSSDLGPASSNAAHVPFDGAHGTRQTRREGAAGGGAQDALGERAREAPARGGRGGEGEATARKIQGAEDPGSRSG